MININDIKNGMTILYEGNIYQIVEFQHVKPGKGSAFVRTKLKNLRTNSTIDITFNAGIDVERAIVTKSELSYLYNQGDMYVFMDNETYEQLEIHKKQLEDQIKFLKEGLVVLVIKYEDEIIGIELPEKISYKITYTEPAVKGNTTSSAQKDATIETGHVLKVPLFINEGDEIIVTTRDGKYSSRA